MTHIMSRHKTANPFLIAAPAAAAGAAAGAAGARAEGPLTAYAFLRGEGYTSEFAYRIVWQARLLAGRFSDHDPWSLLAVSADELADALHFEGFQRRRLKAMWTKMQVAKDAGQSPLEFVRMMRSRHDFH